MKKKLLAAAIMVAMTLSTASVFAAPVFSGDANIEYNAGDISPDYLINRIRLNIDSKISDDIYVHGRMKLNNDLRDSHGYGATAGFDQAYIGAKLGAADIRVGRQSLFIGKGLLMDEDNFTGAQARTAIDGINLAGFYGRDASDNKTSYADMNTSFSGINFGATYLKEGDKYFGVNADTKIAENAVLNVEYVKNDTLDADGYMASVKFGNAVKKGDIDYSIAYHNADAGAVAPYTTNVNFQDSKGFMVKASYKVADNATLTAYHDAAKDSITDADKTRTNVEFSVNF